MAYDEHLADRVRAILTSEPSLSERKMFGGLAFMIGGHMCCGIVRTDLMLRLGPEDTKWRSRARTYAPWISPAAP